MIEASPSSGGFSAQVADQRLTSNKTSMVALRVTMQLTQLVVTVLLVSFASYGLLAGLGDPAAAIAGENATREQIAEVRQEFGFDRPIVVQYVDWLGHAARGDFGKSLQYGGRPVAELIRQQLPTTFWLVLGAIAIALPFSLMAGFVGVIRANGLLDGGIRALALVGVAIPPLFLGLWLALIFGVQLRWFPPAGFVAFTDGFSGWLSHLILPWLTLSLGLMAQQVRTLRSSLSTEMQADYIRTARAKSISTTRILFKHVPRNALLPFVAVVGLQIPRLITGAVFVEAIFGLPGVGSLTVSAVRAQDYPVVQAMVVIVAAVTLVSNAIVNMLYERMNPATRVTR